MNYWGDIEGPTEWAQAVTDALNSLDNITIYYNLRLDTIGLKCGNMILIEEPGIYMVRTDEWELL